MTVKISGTDGIDVAQLRPADGDPVAVTIDATGKVNCPQRVTGPGTILANCIFDGALTGTNAPLAGFGVASVTRNSAGNYTITFGASYANNNFIVTLAADNGALNLLLWAQSTVNSVTIVNYVAGVPTDLTRGFVTVSRAD